MSARRWAIMFLLGNSLALTNGWAEQTCDGSFPMSAPMARFTDNRDGTIYDIEPDLTWMRCSLGQTWNGATCSGTPTAFTWQGAQDAAARLNREGGYANHRDWRLPKIAELASIAERQCSNPRINLTLFPATPADYFWTISRRPGSPPGDPYAYAISFGTQGPSHAGKDKLFYVRLVSGGIGR